MMKQWNVFYTTLLVLSTLTWCLTVPATPIIGNWQSVFRMEGVDLVFTPDLTNPNWDWDGGPEVALTFDPLLYTPPQDPNWFREFGAWGGGCGTGLGTIVFDIQRAAGVMGTALGSFHAFFDLDVDESINTFYNEYGEVDTLGIGSGVNPNAFEIDEPGWVFGDIFDNLVYGDLNNSNAVPITSFPDGEDVSVALGWENFELLDGQSAELTIVVSDSGATAPGSSFTIRHLDLDSPATITFSGALEITGSLPTPPPAGVIPEPSTFILLGLGILGIASIRLKRFLKLLKLIK